MAAMAGAARRTAFSFQLGLCAALVALADFLFYSHGVGWTAGLFCLLTLGAAALHLPSALRRLEGLILFALCLTLCLMLVETDNSLALFLFWLFFAALFTEMQLRESPLTWLRKLLGLALNVGGAAAIADGRTCYRSHLRTRGRDLLPALAAGWLLPISLSVIFLALFADANPVLQRWLISLEWSVPAGLLTPARVLFWLIAGVAVWGLLRAGRVRVAPVSVEFRDEAISSLIAFFFSREGVTRSLIAANLMFLAQNLMDAGFLWGGANLPDGITYAEYAHRGAYPLIATALLAAAFVLVAMREDGGLTQDRRIRTLIYLWLAQNLLLVASSIWRTYLYVGEYSLTYLRLAALLWMGLVMVGLALIVIKILRDLPSSWLIKANLFAALGLLIATCPFDMGRFIADYNVARGMATGRIQNVDLYYLQPIGPSALPALTRLSHRPEWQNSDHLKQTISDLSGTLADERSDWRRWTFRAHRLSRELGTPPAQN